NALTSERRSEQETLARAHASHLSAPGGGEGWGEVGDSRTLADTHLTLPALRAGPLPLRPEGRRGLKKRLRRSSANLGPAAGPAQVVCTAKEAHLSERGATRLYIPGALLPGTAVALDAGQTHRLRNVLRLAPGAAVTAFNESAGEWLCHLAGQGRGAAVLLPEHQLRTAMPEPDLWLLFAPIKRVRLDWLVEKATELGAAALLPVWTERTQSERLNRERLSTIAIAAAEQSQRLSVPQVRAAERLDTLLASWPAERR